MLSPHVVPEDTHCCILGERFDLAASGARINLNRTFLVAYLLTGDIETAEGAILLALESWTPETESGEDLFRKILQAALGSSVGPASFAAVCRLPRKLQNVLELAAPSRPSFVLRILVGLPVEV